MILNNRCMPSLAFGLILPLAAAHAQYQQNGGQQGQNGSQYGGQNGGQGYGQSQGGWDAPPGEYSDDLQRHAFHDGMEAARADFSNHVQPSPESHREFRHPQVPFPARDTYRQAYKRGYFIATKHMQEHASEEVPPPDYRSQQGGWDAPPGEYSDDLQRHAFHDGIEAARADMQNRVQFSPEGHEEFRHPHVPYLSRDTYREAFKRGYFTAVRHMQEQGR